jgi:hypothetical protein
MAEMDHERRFLQSTSAHRFPHHDAVYFPEDLFLLGEVLDRIVQSLSPKMRTCANLAEIAKDILVCAATGQRDPLELELAAWINTTVIAAPRLMLKMEPNLAALLGMASSVKNCE